MTGFEKEGPTAFPSPIGGDGRVPQVLAAARRAASPAPLEQIFVESRARRGTILIPYLTAGFPTTETFVDVAVACLEAGADALEIGIPFSDPLLDGPAIQRAQQQALEANVTPAWCLEGARLIRRRTGKPLLFMSAYNPVLSQGVPLFCGQAREAGISALIIPDLPFEEQGELRAATAENALDLIQLLAPTSPPARLQQACAVASGFVYCISVSGLTGVRSSVSETARPLVDAVRKHTGVAVAVGFGIAGPSQAREVARFADGIIVGSALIDAISASQPDAYVDSAVAFIRSLREAVDVHPDDYRHR